LHSASVDAELPDDPFGRADMAVRVPRAEEQLAELEHKGMWRRPAAVGRLLDAARDLPRPAPTAIVHGDLYFRHLLVDESDRLAGVIDWGDLCRGDPAVDLSMLWSLTPEGRREFLAVYPISGEQLLRARMLGLFLFTILALYAHHEGLPVVKAEALLGLDRAATE